MKTDDAAYNQAHYEVSMPVRLEGGWGHVCACQAVGEAVTQEVYKLLESKAKLVRTQIPVDARPGEPSTFIFHSPDYQTHDKLMVRLLALRRIACINELCCVFDSEHI